MSSPGKGDYVLLTTKDGVRFSGRFFGEVVLPNEGEGIMLTLDPEGVIMLWVRKPSILGVELTLREEDIVK
jgi:hypothetical protein